MIIDASVLLHAFLPDETQPKALAVIREHVLGKIQLKAPALLPYEIGNVIWQAERRGRITSGQAECILKSFSDLDIELLPQGWEELLPLARRFERTVYDAAYLALAQEKGETLLTGDLRLYHAVHAHLDWVMWIEDFPADAQI